MEIKIERAKTLKEKPGADQELGFGKFYTDHMFVMDWDIGQGWHDARIVPFGPIQMDPASMELHYAQETFEGLKAYRTKDDRILLFRPEMNARLFANSNKRLCMPEVSEEDFVEAVTRLVDYEKDWVPAAEGTSLYIRPFMFATEAAVGVHPASSYKFVIILSPDLCRRRIRACDPRRYRLHKMRRQLCGQHCRTGKGTGSGLYTGIVAGRRGA